jgi:hypothetical protein
LVVGRRSLAKNPDESCPEVAPEIRPTGSAVTIDCVRDNRPGRRQGADDRRLRLKTRR